MSDKYSEQQYGAMRTAFLTAYPKIFTDIDFSSEIFSAMKTLAMKKGFAFLPNHFSNEMSVEIEARHKALNFALEKFVSKDDLVIEIAAGLSPRHLQYKNLNYLELDFKPIMDIKREIYQSLSYGNLVNSLNDIDVTNIKELHDFLTKVLKHKNYHKVIILNEGLFWYLSKIEITNLTNELASSMCDFDWMWITADCPVIDKVDLDYRNTISNSAKVKRKTFEDYEDFSNFFKDLGLSNKRYQLSDFVGYKNLSSAKFFSLDENQTMQRINTYTNIAILKPISPLK